MMPASFRQVEFLVESARLESAPLEAEHILPGKDVAADAVEIIPLGAGPRTHVIDAFLWGQDYDRELATLEAALEDPEPALLVHPWRGSMLVRRVGKIFTDHRKDQGGYVRVRFTCRETSDEGIMVLRVEDVESPTSALVEAAAELVDRVDVNAAVTVASSVLATYESGVSAVREAYATIVRAVGMVDVVDGKLAELGALVDDFLALPGETLARVGSVVDELLDLAAAVEAAPGRFVDSLVASVGTFADLILEDEESRPAHRADEAEARRRVATGLWAAFLGGALRVGAAAPYASRGEALRARADMLEEVDRFIEYGASGATADASHLHALVHEARSQFAGLLDRVARQLPELRTITLLEATPAIELAYRLYADPLREAEIVERNRLATPDLIPAGTVLEVVR